jgi:hypothetical protein
VLKSSQVASESNLTSQQSGPESALAAVSQLELELQVEHVINMRAQHQQIELRLYAIISLK